MNWKSFLLGAGAAALVIGGTILVKKHLNKKRNRNDFENDIYEEDCSESVEESAENAASDDEPFTIEFNINDIQDNTEEKSSKANVHVNDTQSKIVDTIHSVNDILIHHGLGKLIDWRKILRGINLHIKLE